MSFTMPKSQQPDNPLFESHPRTFAANRYVYPVLSRRAGGISIGVNLNPDRACNFHCVYCQVDRAASCRAGSVDLDELAGELDRMVALVATGRIFEGPPFRDTPEPLRRLNDIALSGDGEPTLSANFDQAVELCAEVRRRRGIDDTKLVLITNATRLDQPGVRRAMETLDRNHGEIWAKLDAGDEARYRLVNRSAVPWQRILDNLRAAAIARPIVIQSLFLAIRGQQPSALELDAYCSRLGEITAAGGQIKLVQIHTIARSPAESWVSTLDDAAVDAIAELVRHRTGLNVAAFYGAAKNGKQTP
ncbi:MAG: radical SAM protein [Thermoguttaceae bacterium]